MEKPESKRDREEVQTKAQVEVQKRTAPVAERRKRSVIFESVLVFVLVLFGVLAYLAKTIAYFDVDLRLTHYIQDLDQAWFFNLMSLISWGGFPPQAWLLPTGLVLLLSMLGLRWEAAVAALAALSESFINVMVKYAIQRPRPSAELVDVFEVLASYSFPSGHVMYYTGFYGFLWFLSFTLLNPSLMRTALLIIFGSIVLLVGPSRIFLGQHWASDVLGAYLLGGLLLALIIILYRWGKTQFFVDQPVASEADE